MTQKKTNKLIILDVTLVIFILASTFTGTMAWFSASRNVSTNASSFSIANKDATIKSVTLYKFDYKSYLIDGVIYYDYISPSKGSVNAYSYDFERGQFGSTVDGEWVRVSEMNLYDPDAYYIYGGLLSLNCNAVYKITFSSSDFTDAELHVSALKKSVEIGSGIPLSTCADFDVFVVDDFNPVISYPIPTSTEEDENDYRLYQTEDGRPVLTEGQVTPAWHPSYKNSDFTPEEEIYYKASRLANVSPAHDNFYSEDDDTIIRLPLNENVPIEASFEEGTYTIYLNVNYAPSQLESYKGMDMDDKVRAVYDYGFSFYFE